MRAHEIGHNIGGSHTHDYCPPLDHCYTNCDNTALCTRGTLMSYCHTFGGMANIDLYFHPVNANIMRQRVNASCLDDAGLPVRGGARSALLDAVHVAPARARRGACAP